MSGVLGQKKREKNQDTGRDQELRLFVSLKLSSEDASSEEKGKCLPRFWK